jgi:hypothetical protein
MGDVDAGCELMRRRSLLPKILMRKAELHGFLCIVA